MITVLAFVFGFYLGALLMSLLVMVRRKRVTESEVSFGGDKELSVKENLQTDSHQVIVPTNSHY